MGAAAARLVHLRPRVWALIVVLLIAALGGGYYWLRDSSLVAVDKVRVSGVTGAEAPDVRRALEQAAREMTTLHVDEQRLRRAVAAYPQVKDLEVRAQPLHELHVKVIERPPVATLSIGGARTPVAADGTVLRGRVSTGGLPVINADALPAGGRVTSSQQLRLLAVLAAAPAPMRKHIERVELEGPSLVAVLRDGPRVLLGDDQRAHAKWVATARVLGDDSAAGAGYIDVRLPERPAAGGFATASADTAIEEASTSTGG